MNKIFFDSWDSLLRTFIITILAYIAIIVFLRISGKRTLSKMNAFDFIITIALGSAFATITLNKKVTLADGALVFFLLIFLQFGLTWLSVRNNKIKRLITHQPVMLLYKGELFKEVLKHERVTIQEVYAAARQKGISNLETVDLIIFEPTGDILVIENIDDKSSETLKDVIKHT